jgi:hypothetical protein
VTIIGYDDNFPKEYFKKPASEDGAWITYNSNLGSAGFYYISYCAPLEYAFSHSVTDKFDKVLSYDAGNYISYPIEYAKSHPLADVYDELLSYYEGSEQDIYIKTGSTTKTANVFRKEGKLAAVGTYNDFDKQDIKIEVYDADFKELLYSQDAVLDYHGYHTIELDKPVDVKDFAIAVSYTKGAPVEGGSIDGDLIDISMKYVTFSGSGQSFVYLDEGWKDLTDSDIKKALNINFEPNNCCIKALFAK